MTPLATCATCDVAKAATDFPADRTAKTGRRIHCSNCLNAKQRSRYAAKMDARAAAEGRLRRYADWGDRFLERVEEGPDCWEWRGAISKVNGYGLLGIHGTQWRAHRVSYLLHYGDLPADCFVCHHCDNRKCVRPDHLYAGDTYTNNQDAVDRDRCRWNVGEDAGSSKITAQIVIQVRDDYATGAYTQRALAKRHGISQAQVWNIVNHRQWTHVA